MVYYAAIYENFEKLYVFSRCFVYTDFGEAVSKTTPPFPVLDFCVPYFQLIDRTIVKFYGMASKHTIIQSPEVLITSKDGKIVRLGNYQISNKSSIKLQNEFFFHKPIFKLQIHSTIFRIFYFRC